MTYMVTLNVLGALQRPNYFPIMRKDSANVNAVLSWILLFISKCQYLLFAFSAKHTSVLGKKNYTFVQLRNMTRASYCYNIKT